MIHKKFENKRYNNYKHMKKILSLLLLLLLMSTCLLACNNETLPLPEVSDGLRGDLGIDKNINEKTIDKYLNRKDSVYRDMRMLIDDADYEAIGGDSYLSGFVSGFEVISYPYLCNVEDLPEEVGSTYTGVTLFSHENDEYIANYAESFDILEKIFPKDKNIFLMCGGGGYAGMTKKLLVALGWDANKIYNVGGYWYYNGQNNINVKYEENGETKYNFDLVKYHEINFDSLTKLRDSVSEKQNADDKTDKSDFIQLKTVEDLQKLESEQKTFPLFVFLSGCSTCAEFKPIVKEFTEKNNIKMYSVNGNDIWGNTNSVTAIIEYAPSMLIYKDGKVIAYIESTNNDDTIYFKNVDKLSEWFKSKIDLDLFEKNIEE